MSNPWDEPFPIPVAGDADCELTLGGVGFVMSEWESVELNLARIYSIFVGQGPSGQAIQAYGVPRIFQQRRTHLQEVAEKYFVNRCDQYLEGELKRICDVASKFSERRNEVAHGLVMRVDPIQFFATRMLFAPPGKKQYLLVPPFYTIRNHDALLGMPTYAFNRFQLLTLTAWLGDFNKEIVAYRHALTGR